MDYSKLSDKEVNRKVQIASRLIGSLTGRGVLIVRDGKWEFFDPCNNPADAWPIITANKISIYAMSEADKRGGWRLQTRSRSSGSAPASQTKPTG